MNPKAFKKKLVEEIINSVRIIPAPLRDALLKAGEEAQGPEKIVLQKLVENSSAASDFNVPVCQDTGIFEIWFIIGKDADIRGMDFSSLADEALKEAHVKGSLRESMPGGVRGSVHISFSPGRELKTIISPRGFGSENYTFLHSLNPPAGEEEIKKAVIDDIKKAAGKPCPPYVIGIGHGGTASAAVNLSAFALSNINYSPSGFEKEILDEVNKLGHGAGAVGGKFSALGIKIESMPAHIAGLQLCVHVGCWCNRVRKFCYEEN